MVDEADRGCESARGRTDAGGRGNVSFGFALAATEDGAIGLNDGGGGKTNPEAEAGGGETVCMRDAGREDGADPAADICEPTAGPTPGVLDGVIGREGTIGGANAGTIGDRATLPADDALPAESKEPKRMSRSLIAPVGEVDFAPTDRDDD